MSKNQRVRKNLKRLQKEFIQISTSSSLIAQAEKEYEDNLIKVKQPVSQQAMPNYEINNPFRFHTPADSSRPSLPSTSGVDMQQDEAQKSDNTPR